MIEQISNLPPGCFGLRAEGNVTREDYLKVFEPILERAHREGARIRLLYELGPDLEGFTPGAAWEDARLGLQYVRLLERCAVVSDIAWVQHATRFMGALMPYPTRSFSLAQRDEAIAWLSQEAPSSGLRHRLLPDVGVLVIEPDGKLRAEDFEALALTVDPWIEAQGALHGIVVHARHFPGWENLGALWRHMRFVRDHHQKVKRLAVSADGVMAELGPRLAQHLVDAEARHFAYDEFEQALAWASAPVGVQAG